MRNPLKRDPSRTTMLRKKYMANMRRRFSAVSRAIQKLIVKEDALGLVTSEPLTFMQKQVWRFNTDANKIKSYRKWLQQQIDAKILTVDAVSGKPWNATYAESAYRKGMLRAYTQVHKQALAGDVAFYEGGKAQFLREAFSAPVVLSKIELIYTRAFDELKGVTAVMGQQMGRILADGLIKGDGPKAIARELRKNVATITKRRAIVIARTEVIRAHAEGQLDSFERLGVKELGLMAEWQTAGDDRVCELCGALSGQVFTVDEARAMLPLHPSCRCAWVPFLKGISKRKTKREIRERLKFAIPRWPSTKRRIKAEKVFAKPITPVSFESQQTAWIKSLSKEDKFTIGRYTSVGGSNVVNVQRDYLKGKVSPFALSEKKREYLGVAQRLELLIDKAPVYDKAIFRGMSFRSESTAKWKMIRKKLDSNQSFTFDSMQSFTTSEDIARKFTTMRRDDIRVMITMKKAPKRSAYIKDASLHKSEEEVIVGADSRYRVVSKMEKFLDPIGKIKTIVYEVEEVL